jgi:hypothetical protein
MSIEVNKAIVGRWFTEFLGADFNPDVIDELAAPDIRLEYSLHAPCRGHHEVGVARVCRMTLAAVADRRRIVMPRAGPRRARPDSVRAASASSPRRPSGAR